MVHFVHKRIHHLSYRQARHGFIGQETPQSSQESSQALSKARFYKPKIADRADITEPESRFFASSRDDREHRSTVARRARSIPLFWNKRGARKKADTLPWGLETTSGVLGWGATLWIAASTASHLGFPFFVNKRFKMATGISEKHDRGDIWNISPPQKNKSLIARVVIKLSWSHGRQVVGMCLRRPKSVSRWFGELCFERIYCARQKGNRVVF